LINCFRKSVGCLIHDYNPKLYAIDIQWKYFQEKALAIFVKPPSIETLAERLKDRSTETEETLQVRIGKAVLELAYESKFETVLINEKLTEALVNAEQLVTNFIAK
jgi:guanylate kinase